MAFAPPVRSGVGIRVGDSGTIDVVIRFTPPPSNREGVAASLRKNLHLTADPVYGSRTTWDDDMVVAAALNAAVAREDASFSSVIGGMTTVPPGVTALLSHGLSRLVGAVVSSTEVRTRQEAVFVLSTMLDTPMLSSLSVSMSTSALEAVRLAVDDAIPLIDWIDPGCVVTRYVLTMVAMLVWSTSPSTFNIRASPTTASGHALRAATDAEEARVLARRNGGAPTGLPFSSRVKNTKAAVAAAAAEKSKRISAAVAARKRPDAAPVVDMSFQSTTAFLVDVDAAVTRVCMSLFREADGGVATAEAVAQSLSSETDTNVTGQDVLKTMHAYRLTNMVSGGGTGRRMGLSTCVRQITAAKGSPDGPLPPVLQPVAGSMQELADGIAVSAQPVGGGPPSSSSSSSSPATLVFAAFRFADAFLSHIVPT